MPGFGGKVFALGSSVAREGADIGDARNPATAVFKAVVETGSFAELSLPFSLIFQPPSGLSL
jgi:hypothetical protein